MSNAYLKYLCEFSKSCPISTDFIICSNSAIWVAGILTVYYGWGKPFVGALFSGYLAFEALGHNISFLKLLTARFGNSQLSLISCVSFGNPRIAQILAYLKVSSNLDLYLWLLMSIYLLLVVTAGFRRQNYPNHIEFRASGKLWVDTNLYLSL